ncbi:MAG: LytTR family DNA-binding domain-containing protein [Muribaculaceae bacterium]|nr:LytTR family DNA-binding domain-containing protein [Muribaculaceae bacterium]
MKCVIVDDLPIARKGMRRLIESRPELDLVGAFDSAEELLNRIEQKDIDLIFLDIRMPGLSGLQFARLLPPEVMIIFTTAFSEYALESYDLNAIDYLVKPIDPEKFNRAVDKALTKSIQRDAFLKLNKIISGNNDFITVKSDRKYIRLRQDDILFIEGCKDMVVFHLEKEKIYSRATLKSVNEILPETKFLRINKSYIVNRDKITSFDNNDIFIGNYEIAIGPTYHLQVMNFLLP